MNKVVLLTLIGASTLMIGCKEISGTLNILQQTPVKITVEERDVFCDIGPADDCIPNIVTKKTKLREGIYSKAKIKFNSKKKVTLELKEGKKIKTIEMKLPKGTKFPEHYGQLNLSAEEINQPFDLYAVVDTDIQKSETHFSHESCSYKVKERVCERVQVGEVCKERKRGRNAGKVVCRPKMKRVCQNKWVTHYGQQEVEYHYTYTTTTVDVDLLRPQSDHRYGQFSGSETDTDKVYEYKGRCY